MSSPPAQIQSQPAETQSPPIENFLATVLHQTIVSVAMCGPWRANSDMRHHKKDSFNWSCFPRIPRERFTDLMGWEPLLYSRGRQPTARWPDQVRQGKLSGPQSPYQIAVTVRPLSRITFYDSALLATSCIEYLRETT